MRQEYQWHCADCGEFFEVANKDYCDGGYLGEPHYTCPFCRSDELEEAYQCELCGEWVIADEIYGSIGEMVCMNCIEKHTTIDTVMDFSKQDLVEVDIPAIIADNFSEKEITDILYKWFKETLSVGEQMSICKEEVRCNYSEFAEFLVEKEGN